MCKAGDLGFVGALATGVSYHTANRIYDGRGLDDLWTLLAPIIEYLCCVAVLVQE